MHQIVTFPTRAQNILDLCFVSHPDKPVSGLSDHDAVLITFQTCTPKIKQNSRIVYLYKLADWDKIREELSNLTDTYFDLNQIYIQSVDEIELFSKNFQQILDDHVPTKQISSRSHLPWMTATLKRLIRKKQRVYNCARRYSRESDWLEYKSLKKV